MGDGMKKLLWTILLAFSASTVYAQVPSFRYLTGASEPPIFTCSFSVNNGMVAVSSTPLYYQCSNVTGTYQWNAISGVKYAASAPSGACSAGALPVQVNLHDIWVCDTSTHLWTKSSGGAVFPSGGTAGTVPYNLTETPAGGVQGAAAWALPGVPGRTVTGATDAIVESDRGTVVTYNRSSAIAVALTSATTIGSNFDFAVININAGAATFTPGAGTINGGSTLVVNEGDNCVISSPDNTNYTALCSPGTVVAGTNVTITKTATGKQINATSGSTSVASVIPGDLICAVHADTTILPETITGGTSTGSSCTVNYSFSTWESYVITGQVIGVAGNSTTGLNGGPYTTTAGGNYAHVSFPCTVAAGSIASGGTLYRWCENQVTDGTTAQNFAYNQKATGSLVTGAAFNNRVQMAFTSSSSAPAFYLRTQGGLLYPSAIGVPNSKNYAAGELDFNMVDLGGLCVTTIASISFQGESGFAGMGAPTDTCPSTLLVSIQFTAATAGNAIEIVSFQ